jgi:hypothetical protein
LVRSGVRSGLSACPTADFVESLRAVSFEPLRAVFVEPLRAVFVESLRAVFVGQP